MNAMPWKGHILFTDFNSGLWAAKLEPKHPARGSGPVCAARGFPQHLIQSTIEAIFAA
jgi:hypothetical protein